MIADHERELIERVLDCVDVASTCGIGNDEVAVVVDIVNRVHAAQLSDEELNALRLVPGVMEAVYQRALIDSVVMGEPDPKHDKIEHVQAAITKILIACGRSPP